MNKSLADIPLFPAPEKLQGKGKLGLEGEASIESVGIFVDTISLFIGIMTVVAFIYFFFLLLIGGIAWMTAGGDKAKVAEARSKITSGLIGLIIVVSAIFILQLIAAFIGFDAENIGMEILTRFNF